MRMFDKKRGCNSSGARFWELLKAWSMGEKGAVALLLFCVLTNDNGKRGLGKERSVKTQANEIPEGKKATPEIKLGKVLVDKKNNVILDYQEKNHRSKLIASAEGNLKSGGEIKVGGTTRTEEAIKGSWSIEKYNYWSK